MTKTLKMTSKESKESKELKNPQNRMQTPFSHYHISRKSLLSLPIRTFLTPYFPYLLKCVFITNARFSDFLTTNTHE